MQHWAQRGDQGAGAAPPLCYLHQTRALHAEGALKAGQQLQRGSSTGAVCSVCMLQVGLSLPRAPEGEARAFPAELDGDGGDGDGASRAQGG